MMDYPAGVVAIFKLFQVQKWVAANSFFWWDENKPQYGGGGGESFKPAISMMDFFFLIPCFVPWRGFVPQSRPNNFDSEQL